MQHRSMLRLQRGRQGNAEIWEALEDAIQGLNHLARIHEMTPRMRATFAMPPE
jgi:two-component sensor histidine kinase